MRGFNWLRLFFKSDFKLNYIETALLEWSFVWLKLPGFHYLCVQQISLSLKKNNMKKIFSLIVLCICIFTFAQTKLPFTGHRSFDLLKGYSGSGTPHYYLNIQKNGDVVFGYVQVNQADRKETTEEFNAGKYALNKVMKVVFKKYKETFFVKFGKDKIYLTDEKGNILNLDGCCSARESIDKDTCSCESELYE